MMNRRALLQLILTAPGHRLVPLPPAPLIHRFGSVTMTITPPPGRRVLMMFLQDEIRAIRWPASIQWKNGVPEADDGATTIIPMHWIGAPL